MASDNYPDDLPATWPFRAAGTVLLIALAWFCAGFALEDIEEPLPNHTGIFYLLILAAIVLVVAGGIYNSQRERKRKQNLG